MKKSAIILFAFFVSSYTLAQKITLQHLKECKNIPQFDYIQLPDKEIVYPVTGLTEIHMESITAGGAGGAGGGGLFAVIECWVVDAKGKIVYNNIHTINPRMISENQVVTDADYFRYMKKNERDLRKRRRSI